jgi:putative salt-induced outer membrane protein YdiY
MTRTLASLVSFLTVLVLVRPAAAQAPPPEPPKIWTITASAGLALTTGNTETSTINMAYDIVYDPKTRNVVKSDGLYLRGETDGELTAKRLGLNIRDEYALTPRLYVFGQNLYLRDEFKNIDYLIAPTGGIGFKIINTDRTKFSVDGGAGVAWEKNPGRDLLTSGALTVGEKVSHALTATTTLTHAFVGLWKTQDFDDALYTVGAGIAVSISTRTQLKVEWLDTYKNKPPSILVKKNDMAVLMALVYKM